MYYVHIRSLEKFFLVLFISLKSCQEADSYKSSNAFSLTNRYFICFVYVNFPLFFRFFFSRPTITSMWGKYDMSQQCSAFHKLIHFFLKQNEWHNIIFDEYVLLFFLNLFSLSRVRVRPTKIKSIASGLVKNLLFRCQIHCNNWEFLVSIRSTIIAE